VLRQVARSWCNLVHIAPRISQPLSEETIEQRRTNAAMARPGAKHALGSLHAIQSAVIRSAYTRDVARSY
jgi:hypothetical protein